jgi:hypothetical protein
MADQREADSDLCTGEVLINKPFRRRDLAATVHHALS